MEQNLEERACGSLDPFLLFYALSNIFFVEPNEEKEVERVSKRFPSNSPETKKVMNPEEGEEIITNWLEEVEYEQMPYSTNSSELEFKQCCLPSNIILKEQQDLYFSLTSVHGLKFATLSLSTQ